MSYEPMDIDVEYKDDKRKKEDIHMALFMQSINNMEGILRSQLSNEIHFGVKCDVCDIEPIIGTRYKCLVCQSINLCELCERTLNGTKRSIGTHDPNTHLLLMIRRSVMFDMVRHKI